MIQSKNHDLHNRQNAQHGNPHDHRYDRGENRGSCGPDCKCGCQEGKACTCGEECAISPSFISGLFSLISALIIGGTIVYATNIMSTPRPHIPPVHAPAAAPANMDKAIEAYIKKNPQVIMSALEEYGRKQQRAPQQPQVVDQQMLAEILADKTNHVLGNPKGSFVIVEFFDYNCGYCQMMNKKMAEAIKKSDNIRWVLMDAPIFGERSEIIARYAYAAAKQNKFAEYHAALGEEIENRKKDKKAMDEEGLKEIGKKLGLNVDKLSKDADSEEAKGKIKKIREYTTKLGLNGVPMFIIQDKVQPGAFPDEQLEEYIKQANAMKPQAKKKK